MHMERKTSKTAEGNMAHLHTQTHSSTFAKQVPNYRDRAQSPGENGQ